MSAGTDGGPRDRLTRAALVVFIILGIGGILYLGKEVLVPLALATLLSFALSPVARALQKLGAPRAVAAIAALAIFISVIGVWVWFVSGQLADLASQIPNYQHNIIDKLHGLASHFGGGGKTSDLVKAGEDALKEVSPAEAAGAPQRVVVVDNSPLSRISSWGSLASPLLSPIGQFAIVLVFTAFMLAQREDLRNRLIKLIGPNDIYRTTEAIDDAGRRIGRMLFAQVVMNGSFGVLIALALWVIGVPNPALWGALAALARFVPYIGVAIGLIPPLLVAFAFGAGWTPMLLTLGLFVVAESVTGQIIEPIVYGHSSGLSPTAVVVSAAVWAFLWGAVGLVLATPLTTCLIVLGRHAPGMGFLETLLGDAPPLTAHESFYQRMLSGDPRGAAAQARPYLKRGAIAAYYDDVALEALRRAHVDVARGDLDEERLAALTRSTQEFVAWIGASRSGRWRTFVRRVARLGRRAAAVAEMRQDTMLGSGRAGGVAVLHGEHPLDPLAAAMLTHALTRRGLPSEIVTLEQARSATPAQCAAVGLVCLCYIAPLTIAHLRAAAIDARRRCPQAKVMICVWRDPADDSLKGFERRLRCDAVATGVAMAGTMALRLLGFATAPWMVNVPPPRPALVARA